MKQYGIRILKVLIGLFLYALGIYFTVQANIGLAPWDAFSQGLTNITGIPFGTMIILSGVGILILVLLLKEKIGMGTILNTLLIGLFVNFLNWLDMVPKSNNFMVGILMLLLGQVFICLGSYFYISPGLGCGPRDSLMTALGKRMPKVPIGAVRTGLEGVVLIWGWLLGAKVGLGTVVSVFGIGFILQGVFRLLKFDVTATEHESLIVTGNAILTALQRRAQDSKKTDAQVNSDEEI
ncbi:putative membrane protein YczE [Aequitasia blattaphilus]|uniref:YitT family protein n=1 Tax=Aequitasia blattaphilus TaxID=2949332 RepID=A0ABT1EAB3_9FIRM|nr:hypothetical protein [Aequitasia blattaphilus]MCP1102775.1 hypothetical protein [Aequitasia blattaphilus]MCR8615415.1 hypothetical protein [Aequitasia blattaphilus]